MVFTNKAPQSRLPRDLLTFLLLTLAVGALSSVFTGPNIPGWYAGLAKPSFTPPSWLFAPLWTALYILMGFAAWRVWRVASPTREAHGGGNTRSSARDAKGRGGQKAALKSPEMTLFGVQLFFNMAWSWVFFSLHQIEAALIEMAVLWLLILATLILFWRRDRIAGLAMLPCLAWTGFAFCLNAAILKLNG